MMTEFVKQMHWLPSISNILFKLKFTTSKTRVENDEEKKTRRLQQATPKKRTKTIDASYGSKKKNVNAKYC